MSVKCEIVAKTDVGKQRFRNEDNFIVLENFSLAIVADGMGGHVDGDVASKIVAETLKDQYEKLYESSLISVAVESEEDSNNSENKDESTTKNEDENKSEDKNQDEERGESNNEESNQNSSEVKIGKQEKFLKESIRIANAKIFEKNHGVFSLESMGTTVVGLQITECGNCITACVGDSRIYRMQNQEIEQITNDHSLVGELLRHKVIQEKDLLFIQHKNIITRALGMGEDVSVDTQVLKINDGDIFLLCTDGLSDLVENDIICKILLDMKNLEDGVAELIRAANEAGGSDNITVALVKVVM